jgi:hypothetical protein
MGGLKERIPKLTGYVMVGVNMMIEGQPLVCFTHYPDIVL